MLAIHAENLALQRKHRFVLQNVGMQIAQGKLVAVIGPNGSGKSSLLRILAHLEQASPGSALKLFDQTGLNIQHLAQIIAYCPTHPHVNFDFEVRHLVSLGSFPSGLSWAARELKAQDILLGLGLAGLSTTKLSQLSSGEYQQVMLARTFAQDTPLLILDEPTANLDLKCKSKIFAKLHSLCQKKLKTIVFASHDLELVKNHADMVIALKNGEVFSQGSTKKILTPNFLKALFDL